MFENLVSRMSHLTTLSTHSIGTINLLSSIQQWCPNLTSFVLDMSAIYYPSGPVDDLNSRQKQMCELWILLFKTLPSLGRFIRTDISMPMVVLDALVKSCPRLNFFKACKNSIAKLPCAERLVP
ncbi:hypothetical protein BGX21_011454 [Mortierella sp. AD011]|nr:hypothetical protein BGX21_011454 [Mortierella sp. AD011]